MHGHEGFLVLVLHDGGIIATFHRLQKTPGDKTLVVCKLFACPNKPLPKLGVLPFLDRRKIDNDDKHVTYLLYGSLLPFMPNKR